jgi:hypothetical protein
LRHYTDTAVSENSWNRLFESRFCKKQHNTHHFVQNTSKKETKQTKQNKTTKTKSIMALRRRKGMESTAAPVSASFSESVFSTLTSFDVYAKVEDDYAVQTRTGGAGMCVCVCVRGLNG